MRIALLGFVLAMPMAANADSIYLCKAYSGGTFWASNHCNQHNALVERIVSVPDGMPFDQQVNIGNQKVQQSSSSTTTTTIINNGAPAAQGKRAECSALDARVKEIDAKARHPQTGQSQDRLSSDRKQARDRQFWLRC